MSGMGAALARSAGNRRRALSQSQRAKAALLAVILLIVIIAASGSSVFLTWSNIQNILIQSSVLGVLAFGMTMLMVSGGIDLSVGSSVSLSGIVMGTLMAKGWSVAAAVFIGITVAIVVGAIVGVLAANTRTHPFIVTLGMSTLVQGVALLVSQNPIVALPSGFTTLLDGHVLGLAPMVLAFIVVGLFVHGVLSGTVFGRWLYGIGSSDNAARLAGIRIGAVKVAVYSLNGLLVGLAALLLTVQLSSAQPQQGQGLELSAIAAVAVGGTPLAGGRGDVIGTFLGVLLLGLIGNALNLLSIANQWQYVLEGLVIIVAVMAQRHNG